MARKPLAAADAETPQRRERDEHEHYHHHDGRAHPNRVMSLARLGARWRNTALELDLGDEILTDELDEAHFSPVAAVGGDSPSAVGNDSGDEAAPITAHADSAETKSDVVREDHGRGSHESDSEETSVPTSPQAGKPAQMSSVQMKRKQALNIYEASANVHRKGGRRRCCKGQAQSTLQLEYINQSLVLSDFFVHWLLSLTWPELIIASVGTSLFFILVFGGMFHWLDGYDSVQESFAISTQTFLTIGYGTLGPHTLWGHAIVFLETFASVIVLAIVTGIPYIKFSKPHNKLKFTNPVVNMGEHGPQLQIRICIDTQQAQLFNAKFKLTLARTERSSMGTAFTFFDELELKTNVAAIVGLNYTLTHYLNAKNSFLYRYVQQACKRHTLKGNPVRDPLEYTTFFLILNIEGTDIIYQDVVYATKVYQPQDLQFNRFYQDMISLTQRVVVDAGEEHQQLLMYSDELGNTDAVKDEFMLTDPVLCELERECTKDSRGDRPMIDAPHALLSRKDRGNRIACCQRSGLPCGSKRKGFRFLIKTRNCSTWIRSLSTNLYWFSLQLPFGLVLLVSLGVWTFLNFILALVFLIPFEIDNSTEHLSFGSFTGPDHDSNHTLAAAFFFAVQTLSSVGYGYLTPTSWYGDFTVAFFGSIAVVLISVFGGIVFSRLVSAKALIQFSEKAVISNYALDGREYFQFKIYGQWRRAPTINVSVSVFVLVKTTEHLTGSVMLHWKKLKLRCNSFPLFDVPVTVLHEVTPDSPFRSLLKSRKVQELSTFKHPQGKPHVQAKADAIDSAKTQESLFGGGDPTARRHLLLKAAMKVAALSRPSSFRLSKQSAGPSTNDAAATVVNVLPATDGGDSKDREEKKQDEETPEESNMESNVRIGGAFAKSADALRQTRDPDKLDDPIKYVKQLADSEVVEICAYVTGYDTTYGAAIHASHGYNVRSVVHCAHFKEQIYFCPIEKANFVDMSAFDELERDVLWYNRIILRRVFNAFKTHYKLKAVLNRVETGSLREGIAMFAHNHHSVSTQNKSDGSNSAKVVPLQSAYEDS